MKVFILSQQVMTVFGRTEWVDIYTNRNYDSIIQFFDKYKKAHPDARFAVRSVEEIIIADTKE